jgi:CDGSH-type Zn-finger protein
VRDEKEGLMADPIPAQKEPYKVTVKGGRSYFWCACGRSNRQPFCDGSHKGTEFTPVAFTPDDTKDVWLWMGLTRGYDRPPPRDDGPGLMGVLAMRRLLLPWTYLLGLLLTLAACAGDEGPRLPCPQLVMLRDSDRVVKFIGEGRDLTDVEYEAAIRAPTLACRYDDDVLEALVRVNLVALRGPADDDRGVQLVYFVAVGDRDQKIIVREEFPVELKFEGNLTRIGVTEEVEPRIPLLAEETGADYQIFVGLRLTPDELEYNRENR